MSNQVVHHMSEVSLKCHGDVHLNGDESWALQPQAWQWGAGIHSVGTHTALITTSLMTII